MKAAEIRVSLQKPLQYKHPAMAPTLTPVMTSSQDHVTLNHKLRKPLVEKIHRERINSSIEQLKSLLGPEFLKQQPDSKLEKADILAYCKDELHISSEGNLSEADFSPLIVTAKDKSPVYSSLCWPW